MHKCLKTSVFTLALAAGVALSPISLRAQDDRDRHDQGQWQQDRDHDQDDRNQDRDRDHDRDRDRDHDNGKHKGWGKNDHDADDRGAYNGGYYGGNGGYYGHGRNSAAYQSGFEDGRVAGARDRESGHSFRPTNGDYYKNGDRGYNSSFGDKNQYKQDYRSAYEQGYQQGYGQYGQNGRYGDRDHDRDDRH